MLDLVGNPNDVVFYAKAQIIFFILYVCFYNLCWSFPFRLVSELRLKNIVLPFPGFDF